MLIIFDASVSLSLLFREPVIPASLIELLLFVELENRRRSLPAALTSWVNLFLPFPLVSRLQPGVRIRKFF
ncbi:hypothetical protein ABC425_15315 [Brucella melitensis]|uniref:hypothetical protein n=1 Tax=Brucella melitensis TaxID=29459 RepID=UPI0031FCC02A